MPKMLYHAFEYCSLKLPIMPHNFPFIPNCGQNLSQFAPILHCCFQVSQTSDLPSYYTCSVAPYLISAEPHPQVNFILLHWPYAQCSLHQISAQLLYVRDSAQGA